MMNPNYVINSKDSLQSVPKNCISVILGAIDIIDAELSQFKNLTDLSMPAYNFNESTLQVLSILPNIKNLKLTGCGEDCILFIDKIIEKIRLLKLTRISLMGDFASKNNELTNKFLPKLACCVDQLEFTVGPFENMRTLVEAGLNGLILHYPLTQSKKVNLEFLEGVELETFGITNVYYLEPEHIDFICRIANLKNLTLHSISGHDLPKISMLDKLVSLDLSRNHDGYETEIFSCLRNLTALEYLNLDSSEAAGDLEWLKSLSHLRGFSMLHCEKLCNRDLKIIEQLPALDYLALEFLGMTTPAGVQSIFAKQKNGLSHYKYSQSVNEVGTVTEELVDFTDRLHLYREMTAQTINILEDKSKRKKPKPPYSKEKVAPKKKKKKMKAKSTKTQNGPRSKTKTLPTRSDETFTSPRCVEFPMTVEDSVDVKECFNCREKSLYVYLTDDEDSLLFLCANCKTSFSGDN